MSEIAKDRYSLTFNDLREIDISARVEKKNGFSYLSWAFAVDELLKRDGSASWEFQVSRFDWSETVMVYCQVIAFGKTRCGQLPVLNHRNQPIPNPDAMQVNNSMQRCLAKTIALHGIGLYLYYGEDIPPELSKEPEKEPKVLKPKASVAQIKGAQGLLAECKTIDDLRDTYNALPPEMQAVTKDHVVALRRTLTTSAAAQTEQA